MHAKSSKHTNTQRLNFPRLAFLQKVLAPPSSTGRHSPPVIGYSGKDLKFRFQVLPKIHDGSNIAAAVTIVWSRPDGDYIFVFEVVLVAFIDQLMGSCNELQPVNMVELNSS